jgi:hypothetical protein
MSHSEQNMRSVFALLADFFATALTLEQILAFKLPEELQDYAASLLEKNAEGTISRREFDELLDFAHADNLIMMVKAKAELARA